MTLANLLRRSLAWYWRTNVAVVAGVAIAVSVLAGSLLVGDSVRASLRRLALERIGETGVAVLAGHFFREALAADLVQAAPDGAIEDAVPLVALEGVVTHLGTRRRATGVQVFGVDDRFWRFHGVAGIDAPRDREAYLSPALAIELGAEVDAAVVVRVRQASDIPASVLQGRRDDLAQALRLSVRRVVPPSQLGELSLSLGQGPVRSIFVPLARLQRELQQDAAVNALLVRGDGERLPAAVEAAIASVATPSDLGFALHEVEHAQALSLESRTGFVDSRMRALVERTAAELGLETRPVLTYIANTIRIGEREIPYSVVTAADLDEAVVPAAGHPAPPPVWLNEWAARELAASPGDVVWLEYYLWSDEAGLATERAEFTVAGTVPMSGAGGDRTFTPEYPGLTDAERIASWDPPFPVDLRRIEPRDERYWDEYRTAPKAFVRYADGRQLWSSRFGDVTSIRIHVPATQSLGDVRQALLERLMGPGAVARAGLDAHPIRDRALAAARGATDFGEYFFYFSFFLFVSGLILAALFFKLGIEQRASEIGLLHALGYTRRDVGRLFLAEGGLLAVLGTLAGMPGAVAFCALILAGLRTWWVDAVGTTNITLDIGAASLVLGAGAGLLAALLATLLSLRALGLASVRGLMSGVGVTFAPGMEDVRRQRYTIVSSVSAVAAMLLVVLAGAGLVSATAGFFGAGGLFLTATILALAVRLSRPARSTIHRPGLPGVLRLGARQARWRPARTVLVAGLIALATFVIVAVGAFRRDVAIETRHPQSGTGGFPLYAESVMPVMHDPATRAGREALGFWPDDETTLKGVRMARFRLRPGDEGSCLNLYRPGNPRIVAPTPAFLREGRFTFSRSMAATDEERANPWLLLERTFDDGAVPVIGDATSLTYVLHRGIGEDIVVPGEDGAPVVLRVVAALSHSMLQSELIVSEEQFVRLFPRHEGYRFFLIDAEPGLWSTAAALYEERLADLGFDVRSSVDRLLAYERVERTYLATFQTLGALGLIVGTLGLGAVLLRNVLERRRELALLRAVGYRAGHVRGLVLAESALVLGAGILAGTAAALVAVAPVLAGRGGGTAWLETIVLLGAVVVAGVLSSVVAARAATRAALIGALRSE